MRAVAVAACAGLLVIAGTAVALGALRAKVPAKDSFSGRITAATGKFEFDRANVAVELAVAHSGYANRRLTLALRSPRCGNAKHCVQLTGTLKGTLTTEPQKVPDVGSSFTVRAGGTIKTLGRVSATGSVHGTGFIYRGKETMRLRLDAHGGTITLDARSGLVPGFTSP